ncbi:hypothetical protein AAVH_37762 [Aphelenchoides avenae]|nr:hypothetical protein AAVH_37762 [Aphelenchus avenae]
MALHQVSIPVLTGKTEEETPLTRKRYRTADHLDAVYLFIRKNFSDAKCTTLFGEECEEMACSLSSSRVSISFADADIEARLRQMHKPGIFGNATVILMADRGHQFAKVRIYATRWGQLEGRLPFFAVYLPDAFRESGKAPGRGHCPTLVHLTGLTIRNDGRAASWFFHDACQRRRRAINNQTLPERMLCAPLRLEKLIDSKRLIPRDDLLKYNGENDNEGFAPKL